jgi:hypothetical protein
MIQLESPDIGYLEAGAVNKNENQLFSKLQQLTVDLIIDCSSLVLSTEVVNSIKEHQEKINRIFVVILPVEQHGHYPENWNCVPTKTEALDFVAFEQMQRDLGF